MNLTANSTRGRISRPAPRGNRVVVQKSLPPHRTTRIERFLLIAIIVGVSQDRPLAAGFSLGFFILSLCGVYILFRRPGILGRILLDPLFVTAYILLSLASLIEFFHPYASYSLIFRYGQMIGGAIIVASLCRDRPALRTAMHAYLIAGVCVSALSFLTFFNALHGATATDFDDANRVRSEAFKDKDTSLQQVNLNPLTSVSAGVVALASTLSAHPPHGRYLFLAIAVFCSIASTLTLSRSVILMIIGSFAAVMFASGVWRGRTILMAGVIGAAMVMLVPDVVWLRFAFPTETNRGNQEARARVYTAAVEHFPEYAMTGVGVGNFHGAWGRLSQYGWGPGVKGAHNVFIQFTIYWGVAGLLALMALVWQAYRCLPRHCGSDPLSLQLLGVSVVALIVMLSMHNFEAKDFSLVLGLLGGTHRWIWPRGILQLATWKQRVPRPTISSVS